MRSSTVQIQALHRFHEIGSIVTVTGLNIVNPKEIVTKNRNIHYFQK